jgi:hypothetical protein
LKSRTNARLTRLACIALFKWAAGAERKYVPFNACQNLPKLKKSKPREHYLSPDEIKLLWYALDRPDVPFNREEVLGVTMHDLRRTAATCAETWAACHTGEIAYCLDPQDNRDNTAPRLSQHIPQKPAVLQMWKAELLHIIGDETAAPTRVPSKRLLKLVA